MKSITLLLVDDNEIFLNGLKMLLELKYEYFIIKGIVRNGREAVEFLEKQSVDVVLLDIKMPVMSGDEAVKNIKSNYPETAVIMLTTFNEMDLIKTCLTNGAAGYLLKDTPVENIASAVKSSLYGNIQISPEAALSLFEKTDKKEYSVLDQLSSREQEVLLCIARGMNNSRIGEELFISEGTVRNYVSNIYKISGKESRKSLINWAASFGLM